MAPNDELKPKSAEYPRTRYDKNVSPNWKPVDSLATRKKGMLWSDRIYHWLISLGGICIAGVGIVVISTPIGYVYYPRIGATIIAAGLATFFLGFPSQAQRNGYRE